MTDKEIIKALECCLNEDCDNCPNAIGMFCGYELSAPALDLINRQQEQLEAAANGQETLQKALAEKDIEAAKLNLDLKVLREFYNCLKGNSDEIIEENKMLKNEVAELNSDLKLLKNNHEHLKTNFDETVEKNKRLRDKVVGLTAEKERLIETFGECQAEAVREFAELSIKRICENVTAPTPTESYVVERCNQEIDKLLKEMAGDEK